jgi:hypothetical protein
VAEGAPRVIGGRYTVSDSLSVSSKVATYRASGMTKGQVVVKVYGAALGGAGAAALRLAAAATLDLPRSCALEVLEVGVDSELASTFVVTELSGWPSLSHLVDLCPLSATDASALATSLARALAPAHERGLWHLGLKPNNVFVGPSPACDVRLADFSSTIARAALGKATDDPAITPWLAPEQASGSAAGLACDVYSAALVVFYALTGHSIWPAEGRSKGGMAPRASSRAAQLGVSLGPGWDAAFARALAVEPDRRHASIGQLAEAFERAARGEPTIEPLVADLPPDAAAPSPARAPLAPADAIPAPGRSRLPWILAGGVGLAVLGVGALVAAHRAPPPRGLAVEPVATPSPAKAPPTSPAPELPATPGSAAVVAPAAASSTASRPAAVDRNHALLVVTCRPTCDSVWVDGHPIAHAADGTLLAPGVHMVGANLARHASTVKPVLLRGGETHPFDVDFDR